MNMHFKCAVTLVPCSANHLNIEWTASGLPFGPQRYSGHSCNYTHCIVRGELWMGYVNRVRFKATNWRGQHSVIFPLWAK